MLVVILDVSLLGKLLSGKDVLGAGHGVINADDGMIILMMRHPLNNLQMQRYFYNSLNSKAFIHERIYQISQMIGRT